jgi:hypothetical protein
MPTTCLIPKIVQSNGVDLGKCKRLAQEVCRRASAAESWACLAFGRLGRERVAIDFARELAELAEKEAAELRKLTAELVYQLGRER